MTSEGFAFDADEDVWQLGSPSGPVRLDLLDLPGASPGLRAMIKEAMLAMVCGGKAKKAHSHLTSIRLLLRSVVADDAAAVVRRLTLAHVETYRRSLAIGSDYRVGHLKEALARWLSAGVGGLAPDLVEGLDAIPAERHVAGRSVRTCCPNRGPLADAAMDGLMAALHRGHAAGDVALDDYAMCLLTSTLGPRPIQVANLKVRDRVPASRPDVFGADLMLPQAKRGGGAQPRDGFDRRELVHDLAAVIDAQCAAATAWAIKRGMAPAEAPIIPRLRALGGGARSACLPGLEGHMSSTAVGIRIGRVLNGLVALPGLGASGHVFALRLRRTMATGMAADGCSLGEVAVALGDRNLQAALVYVAPTPELAARVDRALGGEFRRFAGRFRKPAAAAPAAPAIDDDLPKEQGT